jgi:predicted DNA-binding protein (MmcQ/YjbR family)
MPWGERVVKVNKKVFVFLGMDRDPDKFGFSVKLPESKQAALALPCCSPTGYGLGKSGWVSGKLERADQLSFAELRAWVLESYRAVAPKSLLANRATLAKKTTAKKATKKTTGEALGKAKSPAQPKRSPKRAPKR